MYSSENEPVAESDNGVQNRKQQPESLGDNGGWGQADQGQLFNTTG